MSCIDIIATVCYTSNNWSKVCKIYTHEIVFVLQCNFNEDCGCIKITLNRGGHCPHFVLVQTMLSSLFSYIIIYLTRHLVREIELHGLVCIHWMYLFERLMKILKRYVRNRNHPKGWLLYNWGSCRVLFRIYDRAKTISVPKLYDIGNKGIGVGNTKLMTYDDLEQAHRIVLENTTTI